LALAHIHLHVTHGLICCRAHADVKAADKALQQLQEAHSKIKPGSSWADRKTCAAVDKLEQLPFREVTQAIIAIKDVEEQWRLANWLTEFVGEAITAAVGWAGKLVNGSEGDWCSDTADIITEMWSESLLAKGSKMPHGYSIMDAQCNVDFAGVYNTSCDLGTLLIVACQHDYHTDISSSEL
jgi:hypothetical protein